MTIPIDDVRIIDFRVRPPIALWPEGQAPTENMDQYDAVLGTSEKINAVRDVDGLLRQMDAAGVDHAVMHAEYEHGDLADHLNAAVAAVVQQYPDRFTGIGAISLEGFTIPRALKQIDQCAEYGFIGLSIQPAFFGMTIDDKRLYPVYAKAMEQGLLVALHTGINYRPDCPMAGENPILLDEIACAFPGLTLVASHAGWPHVAEMVAMARKHPNIYMEFGGLAPKYIGTPGSGWEMMRRFMDSLLSSQIVLGTDWPVMDHNRVVEEWRALGLKDATLERLLSENARRLINASGEHNYNYKHG
tara:strand:- start:16403 stop:17308 length:906 start_codon:yes stop_codon:yes gene_type:complete